jgi:hypothetical protein
MLIMVSAMIAAYRMRVRLPSLSTHQTNLKLQQA